MTDHPKLRKLVQIVQCTTHEHFVDNIIILKQSKLAYFLVIRFSYLFKIKAFRSFGLANQADFSQQLISQCFFSFLFFSSLLNLPLLPPLAQPLSYTVLSKDFFFLSLYIQMFFTVTMLTQSLKRFCSRINLVSHLQLDVSLSFMAEESGSTLAVEACWLIDATCPLCILNQWQTVHKMLLKSTSWLAPLASPSSHSLTLGGEKMILKIVHIVNFFLLSLYIPEVIKMIQSLNVCL